MAQDTDKLPAEVARHLGHYVYLHIDPRTDQPFYPLAGGQGNRMFAHLDAEGKSRKVQILSELRAANLQPRLDVLAHGLKDADTALRIRGSSNRSPGTGATDERRQGMEERPVRPDVPGRATILL